MKKSEIHFYYLKNDLINKNIHFKIEKKYILILKKYDLFLFIKISFFK